MAKNKPKINNQVLPPKYRVHHQKGDICIVINKDSLLRFVYIKQDGYMTYVYSTYKDGGLDYITKVKDYTHYSDEEIFQESLVHDIKNLNTSGLDFEGLVQMQKVLKHHMQQYLYPSKLEMINMKNNYIIDLSLYCE